MVISRRAAVRTSLVVGSGLLIGGSAAAHAEPGGPQDSAAYDAEAALRLLREGNGRWRRGAARHPHTGPDRRAELEEGQWPFATVLGCADSRVPPERVFDRGLGDLFTVRTAGQVPDFAVLAGLAYAVQHLHTPLVVVLGHAACGAVSAAVEAHRTGEVPGGHLGPMVEALLPVVAALPDEEDDLVEAAVTANARELAAQLREDPEIGSASGGPPVVSAARYELGTGSVRFLD